MVQKKIDPKVINEVEIIVKQNLADTLSRLQQTAEYIRYLEGMKEKEKLIKKSGIL